MRDSSSVGRALALQRLEFLRGERRLAQHLRHQPQRVGQLLAERLAGRRRAGFAAADADVRAQLVERVLQFLPVLLRGAAHQHRAGELPVGLLAERRFLVREVQRQREIDAFAARLLGQQRDLHAVRQREALRARVEVGDAGVERLAQRGGGVALVVLDHRGDVDRRRHGRAVGRRVRNELADGHVGALEVLPARRAARRRR